jgi:hypothetical protein
MIAIFFLPFEHLFHFFLTPKPLWIMSFSLIVSATLPPTCPARSHLSLSLSISVLFYGTGAWIQGLLIIFFFLLSFEGLTLSKQVLYHLSHPFCIGYFWDGVSFYAQTSLVRSPPFFVFPHVAGSAVPSYWLRWGLSNLLSKLALNHDPPNLHLLST